MENGNMDDIHVHSLSNGDYGNGIHTKKAEIQQLSDVPLAQKSTEGLLREIWAHVLDIRPKDISPESHFFELGGDSMATAELVAIAEHQGMHLSRYQVFEAPVFAEMFALTLSSDSSLAPRPISVPPFTLLAGDVGLACRIAAEQCDLSVDDIEDIYPTTPLQSGLMARSVTLPGAYVSTWLFQTLHPMEPEWLCRVLQQTLQKLPILRTAMVPSSEHTFVQVILPPPSAVRVIRVPSLGELDIEARKPNMSIGKPLTVVEVISAKDSERPVVLWHAHHATYDMSTFELVARHVIDIASGVQVLPAPPSFAVFVAHSLQVCQNMEWRSFWSKQLEDCPSPSFPNVGQEPTLVHRTNAQYTHPIPNVDTKCGFTAANLFRAAWAFLLGCYEHSDDVVFGVTNGGRYAPVPHCIDIVGPTIATTPMRVRLNQANNVAEFLQQISMHAVHINSFEQVGLSNIQQLGPDGQMACSFRTLVNVQVTDASRNSELFVPVEPDRVEPLDYALVLELFPQDKGMMRLRLSYDNTVLQHRQIVQIANQLEKVLYSLMTSQNLNLAEIGEAIPQKRLENGDIKALLSPGSLDAHDTSRMDFASPKPFELAPSPAYRVKKWAAVECGVSEHAIEDVYLCTDTQTRFMEVSLKNPAAYVLRSVLSPRANLTVAEASQALAVLYRRVSVLRSRFCRAPGAFSETLPVSEVLRLQLFQVVIDMGLALDECSNLDEYMASDKEHHFSLGQALCRFAIICDKSADQVRHVVLTAHYAICDDSTIRLMLDLLNHAIQGGVSEITSPLPSSVQRTMQSGNDQSTMMFWAQNLKDCPTPSFPEVPAGHTPLATANLQTNITLPLSRSRWESEITTSNLLRAAWALLLTQYYDSNDVTFGAGFSSNSAHFADAYPVLGPTLSIVPQRIIVDGPEIPVAELLGTVHKQTLQLIANAQYGMSNIQNIDAYCAAACEFQNLFIIHGSPSSDNPAETTGSIRRTAPLLYIDSEKNWSPNIIHAMSIVVEVTSANNKVMVNMSYDPMVLKEAQTRRLMSHYEHVLLQLCTLSCRDSAKVSDISHFPDEHLREVLSWNNVPAPLRRGVHELFEDSVDAHPDSPAICARDGEWTFSEVDEQSENLARWLCSLGVGAGTFVPLLFEKCGLAIIAMLGILKAGGASVALDPCHPPDRLRGLVNSMGECTVICSRESQLLAAELGQRAICIDPNILENLSRRPRLPRLSREIQFSVDNAAFVLFTSGSTGMPKGIFISHRAFASSIRGHSKALRFSTGPGSRNFQFTAYTSDVSIGEIFTSLAVGSCVCVPSEWDRKNDIAGAMRDLKVNWAFFTPSVASLLSPSEVPLLRTLVFGGETASPENFQTWAPELHLINSFGPAECSIWTHCIPRPVTIEDIGSNIGYNLGCATWITDPADFSRLLPIGAIGEMLIEGPNVADYYLNDPVKTANTFVRNPAWMPADRKSMRLYRSGDMARYLPNGMVQFLGRRDHQLKLNGLRVELGEIEHQIRKQLPDGLLVAVDVVRPQPAGSAEILAAFVAPKKSLEADSKSNGEPSILPQDQRLRHLLLDERPDGLAISLQGMEDALSRVLPSHMIPAVFAPLREMPLTASAKTDRKMLKLLGSMISVTELGRLRARTKTKTLPRTVMEQALAWLWSTVLRRSGDLDLHDNFFRIGGDSLSAMRLVSLARKDKVRLSVEQVFQNPVLQDMARVAVVEDGREHSVDSVVPGKVQAFGALGGAEATASAVKSASAQLGVDEADIEDIYQCTPLQEGLMALSQDARGSYVAQMVYELPAELDIPRFESAWKSVVDDWPILRTRFFEWHEADGTSRLMQAVVKPRTRWQRSRSLSSYLKIDRGDKMQVGDRMLRLAAFQDKEDCKRYFVMTAHHAIYDGWMLNLLFTAIRRTYLNVPKFEVTPFNVFVNSLTARDPSHSQQYWQRYVCDASRTSWPELPSLDFRPQPSAVQKITCPFRRGNQRNFTPTTVMRTAFGILIGAYAHTDDVIFSSTVYGRASGRSSAEKVAGPTLATIPVRVQLERTKLLNDIMEMVQSDAAEMLAHEQEGMQNIKRYNRNALATIDAQSLLVVQVDQPPEDFELGDFKLLPVATTERNGGYLSSALVLEATISGEEIHLDLTHDDRIIPSRQAERFLHQFYHVVRQLCNASDQQSLQTMELISPADKEELFSWNSHVPAPTQALVHEFFISMAREQPDTEAVASWEGSFTFRRLDDLSNRLADHLWTVCGLRTGIRIPLLFEKSIWTVAAMLAVLKIGAANVALNPAHPPDHLRSLIEDIDADFVLCSERYRSLAAEIAPRTFSVGPTISVDDLEGSNGAKEITPHDIAFLLFTSGSTGKPKAIMIDHSAFCSSINGHGKTLCYNQGSRNLQFTAYTSDVSIGEIFTSLSRGATVCIPSDEERMNDLAGAMERMRVDWAFLTPSMASLLDPDRVPTLKTLVFGGESATVTNVKTWAPRLHLINSFGPAETSIWCHAHPHFTENDDGTDIGWSVGCATWIVDPEDYTRLMPIGAIGELIVEGPNVAAGYYNNPEKTQATFLKHLPWLPSDRCNRIYRLGDLARWMPDGCVQFLGRKDGQVKLYGQRIEVGEVEHKIRLALGDEGLEIAVEKITIPPQLTESRLIAFMSCTPSDQPQDRDHPTIITHEEELSRFRELAGGLREKLVACLASHMIPSFFVPLSSMPLSASAKTDRKLLRSLVGGLDFAELAGFALSSQREIEPPQSALEKLLHRLWCSILALPSDEFGVEADFFECGGDSIAAMKMASFARAANTPLSVQDIYDHPRLGDLASTLETKAPGLGAIPSEVAPFSLLSPNLQDNLDVLIPKAAELCSVGPEQIEDLYPCTPTQRSLIKRTIARPGAYWLHNAFEISPEVDLSRLEQAWNLVVNAHTILRTRIFMYDDYYLQAVLDLPVELKHILSTSVDQFLAEGRVQPYTHGQPLLRTTLLNEFGPGGCRRYFILTLHHSVYDVLSMTKIFAVLQRIYTELAGSDDAKHDEGYREVGFKYFIRALQEQDRSLALDFWSKYLLGTKAICIAPLQEDYRANCVLRHRISLPAAQTQQGVGKAVTHAVMTYAALGLACNRQLEAPDTIFRLVSIGRSMPGVPDIEDLVGPTMTSIPLRIYHTGKTSLQEYLNHVQAQVRRLTPFEQVGFEDISTVHADAERACRAVPQVVVHPDDPYTIQPAAGIGLHRRELSVFNDDNAPLTVDVSLVGQGKALDALDLRVIFDDRAVSKDLVRRIILDFGTIMREIYNNTAVATVQEIVRQCSFQEDVIGMKVERIEDRFG